MTKFEIGWRALNANKSKMTKEDKIKLWLLAIIFILHGLLIEPY
jgi:hypothetical protein